MSKSEKIYDEAFSRYISPSRYEKMFNNGWFFERLSWGRNRRNIDIRTIQEYLDNGEKVMCGYMATPVRGYHHHYIISKEPNP